MDAKEFLDSFAGEPEIEIRIAGLMHAIQTLAAVLVDTPEKKAKVGYFLETLSETAFNANLTQKQKNAYLDGLSSLSLAINPSG